jgi:chemotaxis protein histidine kinase CheA
MSGETGLEDVSLIELFRSEVETHSELLSAALLALERSPSDTSSIDEMMRAAHSIKGAARVVGVDAAVPVAHAMEDCFLAAQKGTIKLSPADVDVLLRGVDLLGKISEATRDPNTDLSREFGGLVQELVAELELVLSGKGKPSGVLTAGGGADVVTSPAREAQRSVAGTPAAPLPASQTASDITLSFPEILDSAAAEEIRRQLLAAIDSTSSRIRFDLGATKDLDVQGLALLAAVPSHLAKYDRPAPELTGVSPEMTMVLRVTGLAKVFGVGQDLAREVRS